MRLSSIDFPACTPTAKLVTTPSVYARAYSGSMSMSHLAVQCNSFPEQRNLMTLECYKRLRGLKMGKYAPIPGDHSRGTHVSAVSLLEIFPLSDTLPTVTVIEETSL